MIALSICFGIGAVGLRWFSDQVPDRHLRIALMILEWIPFIVTFFFTFTATWPFGRRRFCWILIFAMALYLSQVVSAEVFQFIFHLPGQGHFTLFSARILMYFGFVAFIPYSIFIRQFISQSKRDA